MMTVLIGATELQSKPCELAFMQPEDRNCIVLCRGPEH